MKKNEESKIKGKITLKGLFSNNKFLILLSFVIACVFWVGTALNAGEDTDKIIYNIPVNIEFAQDTGLVAFTKSDSVCSVPVSGNRLTIGTVTADDIQVTAITSNTGTIIPGTNNTFQLLAKKNSSKSDYSLGTPTPALVNVFVDKLQQKDINIDYDISYKIDPSYYGDQMIKSAETVNVSGPETEVSKISKAVVSKSIDGNLTSTATVEGDIKLYDASGNEIQSDFLTLSVKTAEVKIPVLPEKTVPLKIKYQNVPKGIDTTSIASMSTSEIQIAGPESTISALSSIEVGPIDFANISPTNYQFKLDIVIPSDCKNITNVNTVDVSLNLTGFTTKTFTVTTLTVSNIPSGYSANVTTTELDVVIVGPEAKLEEITADNISAVLDLSSVSAVEGSMSVGATINVSDYEACWATGSYKANVIVSKL